MTCSFLALTSDNVRAMPGPVRDERADALRARYHAAFPDAELPVPVQAIAEDLLGLRVGVSQDLAVSGMLLPPERQIWLNGGEAAPFYCRSKDVAPDTDQALEREANVFAAELLMPEPAVRAVFSGSVEVT